MFSKAIKLLNFGLIGSLMVFSAPSYANDTMKDLLKILRDRGSISKSEYEILLNSTKADEEKMAGKVNEMKAELNKAKKDLPKIKTKGKLEFASRDGNNKIRIGGRLQYDTTLVGTDGDYTDSDGSSESQFRRARIYLSGVWAKDWKFKFQYDIEDTQDNDQAIEDAYITYTGFPVHIRLGQGKNPYSMSELTSSKYIAFVERSFVSELFNNGNIGVGNRGIGATLTWNDMKNSGFLVEGSLTTNRQRCSADDGCSEAKLDRANGVTGRIVWADYHKKARRLLHAGVSAGYRKYDDNGVGRVRVRPNVSEGARILDTGSNGTDADSYHSFNINVAAMMNRFWAQAEYFYGDFDLNASDAGDSEMTGFLIQGGVFLTPGDNRRYKNGAWNSVKVKNPVNKGGMGAWELALRYDQATIGAGIQSDDTTDEEAAAFTVGLNFYPVNNVRLQANYVKTLCDGGTSDRCDWDGADSESNPDFFIFRAQTFF